MIKRWRKFLYQNFNTAKLRYISFGLVIVFIFFFGFFLGRFNNPLSFSALAQDKQVVNVPELLKEIKENLNNKFVSWKNNYQTPSQEDLDYGMLKGYVAAYQDPYTQFFTPEESQQFEQDVEGNFGGIGALLGYKDGKPVIMSLLKDTPAEKSGLKSGDVLVSINGSSTSNMYLDQVVRLVRGEIGKEVSLEIAREGETSSKTFKILRAKIEIPVIKTEIQNNVFIIHFYSFTQDSGPKFETAYREFLNSGEKNLLIDLRDNGGGYLNSAIDIASLFLPKDKVVVIEKSSKNISDRVHYSLGYMYPAIENKKIYILIDGGSASASEILAGALKDNQKATILGERSFGKGSVQELVKLSDGSDLKVTVAKWFTPQGVNISESGIQPDILATSSLEVKLDKSGNPIDSQLLRALNIINKK